MKRIVLLLLLTLLAACKTKEAPIIPPDWIDNPPEEDGAYVYFVAQAAETSEEERIYQTTLNGVEQLILYLNPSSDYERTYLKNLYLNRLQELMTGEMGVESGGVTLMNQWTHPESFHLYALLRYKKSVLSEVIQELTAELEEGRILLAEEETRADYLREKGIMFDAWLEYLEAAYQGFLQGEERYREDIQRNWNKALEVFALITLNEPQGPESSFWGEPFSSEFSFVLKGPAEKNDYSGFVFKTEFISAWPGGEARYRECSVGVNEINEYRFRHPVTYLTGEFQVEAVLDIDIYLQLFKDIPEAESYVEVMKEAAAGVSAVFPYILESSLKNGETVILLSREQDRSLAEGVLASLEEAGASGRIYRVPREWASLTPGGVVRELNREFETGRVLSFVLSQERVETSEGQWSAEVLGLFSVADIKTQTPLFEETRTWRSLGETSLMSFNNASFLLGEAVGRELVSTLP